MQGLSAFSLIAYQKHASIESVLLVLRYLVTEAPSAMICGA